MPTDWWNPLTSPRIDRNLYLRANGSYSNTLSGTGQSYGYRQLMVEWIRPF